ncbi:MAG: Glu-tRNA(Gln) amidotransferase subunit GatD [Candidatus Aenigmarchaeota archaeon]|nr:Glu-tRNA(Gln) amidotransferase subunit GatD [Candidatus Aenigmarchaeota archaeon]
MYSAKIGSCLKKEKISSGDKVKITQKGGKEYEGILMPRPDFGGSKDNIILKLKSGYNIGIKFSNGMKIKKSGKGAELEAFPSLKFSSDKNLPKISLVATGGTISSRVSYETGGVKWLMDAGQLFFLAPELQKIAVFRKIEKPFLMASENMSHEHWQKLAETCARLLNEGDEGVVVTHGTDTLHYTSAALSFMLKNLTKPVVLTYSQRSTDRGSTDTPMNLVCAAKVAATSEIAEVVLVGHGESGDTFCLANRGTKVRKMHTSVRHTFRPVNDVPVAKIWPDGNTEYLGEHKKRAEGKVIADTKFEEKVALIKYCPGANPEMIDFLREKKYRGIVIEATGLGHVATDESRKSWLPAIKRAINSGMLVCAAAQTLYGRLDPLVYGEGRKVLSLGVVYLKDMLPETAYVKLGWVLGHTKDTKEAEKMMLANYAGEITGRTGTQTFLY